MLAACDVSLNLRWPTAREVSGPWLRALAAGSADDYHRSRAPGRRAVARSADLDAAWRSARPPVDAAEPVTIAIDILDEDHSLRLAMRRLGSDAELRATLGVGRRGATGSANTRQERMIDDYRRVIARAPRTAGRQRDAARPRRLPRI